MGALICGEHFLWAEVTLKHVDLPNKLPNWSFDVMFEKFKLFEMLTSVTQQSDVNV